MTDPAVDSFSDYGDEPSGNSFHTLVPDRRSFNTLIPSRAQSFATLPAVDSFSSYSDASFMTNTYRTIVPDRRSFQTIPDTGSFHAQASDYEERGHAREARALSRGAAARGRSPSVDLYKDSLEANGHIWAQGDPRVELRPMAAAGPRSFAPMPAAFPAGGRGRLQSSRPYP